MRTLDLRADSWKSARDFYEALGRACYEFDGRAVPNVCNINGLLELLVWNVSSRGNPPSAVRILGASNAPSIIQDEIALTQRHLAEAREESLRRRGFDVEVRLETVR